MYGCKTLGRIPGVSVANLHFGETSNGGRTRRIVGSLFLALSVRFLFLPSVSIAATYTVNVSLSTSAVNPASLLADVLSSLTTGQYLGSYIAHPYLPNAYSLSVKGRNPNYQPPSVSTSLIALDAITTKLVAISTATNELMYGEGMMYERRNNAGVLGYFMTKCSTETAHDFTLCNTILGFADDFILNQTSGMPVVPYPLVGF